MPLPATCSRRLSTCLHLAQAPTKTQTAPSLPNAMGSALPPPHKRPATTLTISLVFGVQLNLSIASATNETRAFPRGSGGKGAFKHANSVDFRTLIGVSDMGRTLVEEVATLASLALFLGMVAIWAQVIATL